MFLWRGRKIHIKDILCYRFTNGELGAGCFAKVLNKSKKRKCVYVIVDGMSLWYDYDEVEPWWKETK